jgi:hypothetical protein
LYKKDLTLEQKLIKSRQCFIKLHELALKDKKQKKQLDKFTAQRVHEIYASYFAASLSRRLKDELKGDGRKTVQDKIDALIADNKLKVCKIPQRDFWPMNLKCHSVVSTQPGWNKKNGMYKASKLFSQEIFGDKAPELYNALNGADMQFSKLVYASLPHIKKLYKDRTIILEFLKDYNYECDQAFIALVYLYSHILGAEVFPHGLFHKWPLVDEKWLSYVPEHKFLTTACEDELMLSVKLDG